MKKSLFVKTLLVLMLLITLLFPSACGPNSGTATAEPTTDPKVFHEASENEEFSENTLIVTFKREVSTINQLRTIDEFPEIDASDLEDLTYVDWDTFDGTHYDQDQYRQMLKVTLKEGGKNKVLQAVSALASRPDIKKVTPNYFFRPTATTNDTKLSQQYALNNISAASAWDISTGSKTVKVGIVDNGIASHSDLNANVVAGKDFYNNNVVTTDVLAPATKDPSHGTHVAGTVGAVGNNGTGISGVCQSVSLVPMQVVISDPNDVNFGLYSNDAIIRAIEYAAQSGIDILNFSFGAFFSANPLEEAMSKYKGLIVCAAGNNGQNIDTSQYRFYPASSLLPNVIGVANTDQNDNLHSSSNYGNIYVDVAAPGTQILSTVNNNSYSNAWTGTSMAAPHVAGVAALIKSRYPYLEANAIKRAIMQSADLVPGLWGKVASNGRLNARAALNAAATFKTGSMDYITPNAFEMGGWACDLESLNRSIDVHIWIRDYYTDQNAHASPFVTQAASPRSDLVSAGYGNGTHGFKTTIDWRPFFPKNYRVYAYAVNGRGNPELSNGSRRVVNIVPSGGVVDSVSAEAISAWAWKPSAPNLPIDIHAIIRRVSDNSTVETKVLHANQFRPDLLNARIGNGQHWAKAPMDWQHYPPGQYRLDTHSVDGSGYSPMIGNPIYTVRPCIGSLDSVSMTGISGWAWKADAPNKTINVRAQIFDANNKIVATMDNQKAGNLRSDLARAKIGNGAHAYYLQYNWSALPKGQYRVVIEAVDGSGVNNVIGQTLFNN